MAPPHVLSRLLLLLLSACASLTCARAQHPSACPDLTLRTWASTLALEPAPPRCDESQWWILLTGAHPNASDHEGHLGAELARMRQADPAVRCAVLDCRSQPVLCAAWLAEPLSIMHVWRGRHPSGQSCATVWRRVPLGGAGDGALRRLRELRRTGAWVDGEVWDGFLHPYVGALGRWGAGPVWGVLRYALDRVPPWLLALVGTLLFRRLLSKAMPEEPLVTAADQVVPPGSMERRKQD